jgi:hypothetical protein
MSVSDYRTALSVLGDEAELLGLYPAKRVEAQLEMRHDTQIADAIANDPEAHELACRFLERINARPGEGDAGGAGAPRQ